MDRIYVSHRDDGRHTCTILGLVNQPGGTVSLTLPTGWGVEGALISGQPSDCATNRPIPPPSWVFATSGSGTVSWVRTMADLSHLDVHVHLSFPATPGLPVTKDLDADGVPLSFVHNCQP
jgi:hypothetical protein